MTDWIKGLLPGNICSADSSPGQVLVKFSRVEEVYPRENKSDAPVEALLNPESVPNFDGGNWMIFDEEKVPEYESWYDTELGNFVDEVETELAFSLFTPESGSRVLDVGCGTGNFSIKLARKGLEVVGVDVSRPMLEKARKKVKELDEELKISFQKMDATDLDFSDGSFDDAFSMATIEFIPDEVKREFVQEMLRVVKPGGKVLIGTITADSAWGEMYKEQAKSKESVFYHAEFTTPEELNRIESDKLQASEECLFIPPDAESEDISWQRENELAGKKRGGFFCSLWKKPAT